MVETEYGRESYLVGAPASGASSPLGTDVPARTDGGKAGFSVIADWGTAEHVELPADCAALHGSAPPQVRLSLLLMLLDPVRFPSPSAAKKKVRQGVVLVNGRKGRIDMLITIGKDRITMQSRTESRFKPLGDPPFHIDVLYEDDVMAVVHKPPGVCTHPPKGLIVPQTQVLPAPDSHPQGNVTTTPTTTTHAHALTNNNRSHTNHSLTQAQSMMSMRCCVPYHVKCAPPGSEGILWRPMLVHRLDKDTEGIQVRRERARAREIVRAREPDARPRTLLSAYTPRAPGDEERARERERSCERKRARERASERERARETIDMIRTPRASR
jgi:hypothetical protein